MSTSRMFKVLNLTNLEAEEKEILASFLKEKSNKNKDLFSKNITYQSGPFEFQFSHNLLRRPCQSEKNKGQKRYEVLTDIMLDENVGEIDSTLVLDEIKNDVIVKRKNRIFKHFPYAEDEKSILNEFEMAAKNKHIHIKEPVFITEIADSKNEAPNLDEEETESDEESTHAKPFVIPTKIETQAYIVMRRLPGTNVAKVITALNSNQFSNWSWSSSDNRLLISLAILRALKKQVHDLGLLHGDLKPDNILIDLSITPPIAYVIDYETATTTQVNSPNPRRDKFTPYYAAPEMFHREQKIDARCDIFSISLIIGHIWGANSVIQDPYTRAKVILEKQKSYQFNGLFHSVNDQLLTDEHKDAILHILLKMHEYQVENRLKTIDDAIIKFEKIQSDRLALQSTCLLSS